MPEVNTPENLTVEVDYAAKAEQQGDALDEAVAWATAKGWELVSIIWREETDNGHVFVVRYNKKPTVRSQAKKQD